MGKHTIKGLLATLLASLTFVAQAAVINCPSDYTGLSDANGCQPSTGATQDFLSADPITVNAEALFGYTDWTLLNEMDDVSGSWVLNEPQWSIFDQILLIFTGGHGSTLVGYSAELDALSETGQSPFSAPSFELSNTRDAPHIGFYGRNVNPITVSEPNLLILLLLGLGTAALTRLRGH